MHKSYGASTAEPFTFDIDGEEFVCHAEIPAFRFMEHIHQLSGGGITTGSPAAERFLSDCMEASEYERFRKYVDDPARAVGATVIASLIRDLIAHYTGRPTTAASASGPGSRPSGTGSTPERASQA